MGIVSAKDISDFEASQAKKLEELRVLTSKPFDPGNPEHTGTLKRYIDNFEFKANQMYLYQSLSAGFTDWKGVWLIGLFLPLPEFVKYFITQFFYVNLLGFALAKFSFTDFNNQLKEMKTLYNWSLKGGEDNYHSSINNAENLVNPDIQRMIKLIAPFCSTDFMIAWTKITEDKEKPLSTWQRGYNLVSSGLSWFSSAKSIADENKINEMKRGVEIRNFDIGAIDGLEQSIKYFTTSISFREIMAAKIKQPLETIKQPLETIKYMIPDPIKCMLPEPVKNFFFP